MRCSDKTLGRQDRIGWRARDVPASEQGFWWTPSPDSCKNLFQAIVQLQRGVWFWSCGSNSGSALLPRWHFISCCWLIWRVAFCTRHGLSVRQEKGWSLFIENSGRTCWTYECTRPHPGWNFNARISCASGMFGKPVPMTALLRWFCGRPTIAFCPASKARQRAQRCSGRTAKTTHTLHRHTTSSNHQNAPFFWISVCSTFHAPPCALCLNACHGTVSGRPTRPMSLRSHRKFGTREDKLFRCSAKKSLCQPIFLLAC